MSEQNKKHLYGTCSDCGRCQVCHGKEWMILQAHPTDQSQSLAAPCLGCAGHKTLKQIERERGIVIDRNEDGMFYEATLN